MRSMNIDFCQNWHILQFILLQLATMIFASMIPSTNDLYYIKRTFSYPWQCSGTIFQHLHVLTLTTSIGWMKVTVITAAVPAIPTCCNKVGGATPAVARILLFCLFTLIVCMYNIIATQVWLLEIDLMDLEKYDYLSWMVSSSAFSHLSKTIYTTEGIGGRPTIYSKSMELSRFYHTAWLSHTKPRQQIENEQNNHVVESARANTTCSALPQMTHITAGDDSSAYVCLRTPPTWLCILAYTWIIWIF